MCVRLIVEVRYEALVDYLFLLNISVFLIFMKYMKGKGICDKQNDFVKLHPNQAYLFGVLIFLLICCNIGKFVGITYSLTMGTQLNKTISDSIFIVLYFVVFIPFSAVILKAKNRSL